MSTKRKISVRKILQTFLTFVLAAGCVVAISSADKLARHRKVQAVDIRIVNGNTLHFLDESAVRDMLFSSRHLLPNTEVLNGLDLRSMERIARSNPWVQDAQIWVDNTQVMHIIITQRTPVVRIFETDGNSYYLDSALQPMPLSLQYAHYTPLIINVPPLRDDSNSIAYKEKLVWLADYLSTHKFWNAQIAQVSVNADREFELTPVLGKQRILIGDTTQLDNKLAHLFSFYKQVLSKVGWDRYNTFDLRYDGQVIAAPALPWKVPKDKALSTMSWVAAIMQNAPQNDNAAGGDAAAMADSSGNATTPLTSPPAKKPAAISTASAQPFHTVLKRPKPPATPAPQAHHNSLHTTTNHSPTPAVKHTLHATRNQ